MTLLASLMMLSSCEGENGYTVNDLAGTYVGAMSVSTPSFPIRCIL
jgi:hypothetical protein